MKLKSLSLALTIVLLCPFAAAQWNQLGPYGGWIAKLEISSQGTLIAIPRLGLGVFRSTNGGEQWIQTSLKHIPSCTLVDTSGKIYLGALDGIYCSTDQGLTWSIIPKPNSGEPLAMYMDSGQRLYISVHNGLFRSSDLGITWISLKGIGLNNPTVKSIAMKGMDSIWVGTDGGGVFRTYDGGANWVDVNIGLSSMTVNAIVWNSRGQMFAGGQGVFRSLDNGDSWTEVKDLPVDRIRVDALDGMLVTGSDGFQAAISRSVDRGDTWEDQALAFQRITNGSNTSYQSSIVINGSGRVFISTETGVYVSDNGVWLQKNVGLTCTFLQSISILSDGTIFVGGDQGEIYRSSNQGMSWLRVRTGESNDGVYALARSANDVIFAGTRGGMYRSTNGGAVWQEINAGLLWDVWRTNEINCIAIDKDLIAAGTARNGVYLSNTFGNQWYLANSPLINSSWVYAVAIDSGGHILAGTQKGLFHSTDRGSSWDSVLVKGPIGSIVVGASGSLLINNDDGIMRSTDDGATWKQTAPMEYSMQLSRDPGGIILGRGYLGFIRSDDDGLTWGAMAGGVTAGSDDQTFALGVGSDRTLFLGTYNSVLRSQDKLSIAVPKVPQLIAPLDGINNASTSQAFVWGSVAGVYTYVVQVADDSTFAFGSTSTWSIPDTTTGRLITLDTSATYYWRVAAGNLGGMSPYSPMHRFTTASVVSHAASFTTDRPRSFELSQNFPNPFNPSTTIRYGLSHKSVVQLTVYSTLGQSVSTLVNGEQEAGYHDVKFNGTNLSSGVYFYRIEMGSFVQTRKLLIIR